MFIKKLKKKEYTFILIITFLMLLLKKNII
jgi:hypothetical protein